MQTAVVRVGFPLQFVCVSVCLSTKTDATRISKLDIQNSIRVLEIHLFLTQKVKLKGQSHESQKHCSLFTLVSADFFWFHL